MRSKPILILWLLASASGLGQSPTRQDGKIGGVERPLGDYSRVKNVQFVVGVVSDIEQDTKCEGRLVTRGPDQRKIDVGPCIAEDLLAVRVVVGSGEVRKGTLVLHLPLHDQSSKDSDRVEKGDVIGATLTVEKKPDSYSCGRLAKCSQRPAMIYRAQEIFRRVLWP
jgi:hypothetical protein